MCLFVRAERDSDYGDEAYKEAYWTEKEGDRRVKSRPQDRTQSMVPEALSIMACSVSSM